MKTTWTLLLGLGIASLLGVTAGGQTVNGTAGEGYYRGPLPQSYRWGPVYHHASTYEEGVQRGAADLVRAHGEYNYWTSAAWINREHAISLRLDNEIKKVETYFAKRELNRDLRAALQPPRPTSEEAAVLAKKKLPTRLSPSQYSPTLGKLSWPAILSGDLFSAERSAIDAAIAKRTPENSGAGSQNHHQILAQVQRMEQKLESLIERVTPSEYMVGWNFLNSLKYESHLRMEAGADLAVR